MPAGRPTKYLPKYCQQIVEFFSYEPDIDKVIQNRLAKKGYIEFPTFERFAANIDVHVDTMIEWCSIYPEFSESYKKCKELQKSFLIQMGLNGMYNPAAFCFVAKNCTDMRDKQEVEHSGLPTPPTILEVVIKNASDK